MEKEKEKEKEGRDGNMLRIKFSHEDLCDYPIDIDIYREHTNNDKKRFIQYRNRIECHYAICPKCENPAIVLGLFKEIEGKAPHARHTKYDVEGLGKFVQETYEWCPNHVGKVEYLREPRAKDRDDREIAIYYTAREHFDQAIYLIEKMLGMKISKRLAREICREYVMSEADMYRGSCIDNIPWMLFFAKHSTSMYGRWIRKGSPLFEFLESYDKVILRPIPGREYYSVDKAGSFLSLNLTISMYNALVEKNYTKEFLTLALGRTLENDDVETVFRTKIEVDSVHFRNMINAKNVHRNDELLSIAREEMPDLV